MSVKRFAAVILAAAVSLSSMGASAAAQGWNSEKTKYELSDGSYATGIVSISGIKYRFDENGELIGKYTGWTKSSSGKKFYYKNGRKCKGWQIIDKKKYYLYSNGGFATGEIKIGGKIYIFDENGVLQGRNKSASSGTKADIYSTVMDARNMLRGHYGELGILTASYLDKDMILEIGLGDTDMKDNVIELLKEHGLSDEFIEKHFVFIKGEIVDNTGK